MTFDQIIHHVNSLIWSTPLVVLALLSGLYYSFLTRFLQVRKLGEMVRLLVGGRSSEKGVSSYQAFAIAISGRVGTGNIAGVATAIALGGPGAIFWMWVIAFLGAASAYIEATLGQIYKEVKAGEYRGGPAFYIRRGLKLKRFALAFAIATILSTGFFLPGVQSNSIAAGVRMAFDFDPFWTGMVVAFFLGLIIVGGVKRIGYVAQVVIPFMAGGYLLVALAIMVINFEQIPEIFMLIVDSAFGNTAAFGGIVGSAIMMGVKRGIFSNEAGQGTAPHAAAAAEVHHPAVQGLVQAFSVYVDTLLVCTATAFMILFTGMYNVIGPDGTFLVENLPGVNYGTEFTQLAVDHHFAEVGKYFVAISLTLFAFTTILAYYYIAETNVSFIQRKKGDQWMIWLLRGIILFAVVFGSVKTVGTVWEMGDIGVGLMAWLNFVAIFMLRVPALRALKDFELQRSQGVKHPVFDPEKLGIQDSDWPVNARQKQD